MDVSSLGASWAEQAKLMSSEEVDRARFAARAEPILSRHRAQSREQVEYLRHKYARPVFGKVRVWDLVERLGSCVDPTDQRLYCSSQQVHVLQMLEAMERDGVATDEMVLVALIHDLGKVLLLTDEDPANVVCMNGPVGPVEAGVGLDQTLIQWNHDEFAYQRLKDFVAEDVAWLIRYHSIEVDSLGAAMDARDLERTNRILIPFARYDHGTKSPVGLPTASITKYRDVIEAAFPRKIKF